jgi:undecaprenyl-diphosphatase
MDQIVIFCAKYMVAAVVLLWLIAWLQASKKPRLSLTTATIIAVFIATILDRIISRLYYDPRPFVTHHIMPLVAHASDNGFPSEHTLFSITLASVLFFYRPKLGYLAFAIGIVVGISRVAAHVHSPIDIIGGILIGTIAGYAGYKVAPKLLKRFNY